MGIRPDALWFITVCAQQRTGGPLLPLAADILGSAVFRHRAGRWFLRLCLVMPDHVHLLASFPPDVSMSRVVGDWKRFLRQRHGIRWQRNFFDHRIRSAAECAEKWHYIRENPVRKGFVSVPDDWKWWTGYHPGTGGKLPGAW